jgi:hypothetical protein
VATRRRTASPSATGRPAGTPAPRSRPKRLCFIQVPWTGRPGRTAGLGRLGFLGDARAAPRAGPWAALLRAGPRAALRAGPAAAPSRAAGPSGRRAADADTCTMWTGIEAPCPGACSPCRPEHGVPVTHSLGPIVTGPGTTENKVLVLMQNRND